MTITKVLIANRGEVAVRVIRAAADAGIASAAVYAEPDANAPFVTLADEAFALGGQTPTESYLAVDKILTVARKAGADAVHPGYGFLSENADFAQAVIDAGLTWIGPSPRAIRSLGHKVTARHIAERVGAPLATGTGEPVRDAAEVAEFARTHGTPIAIKAAFGGGGRGMKVAYTIEEIPELFESATREAAAAFGRGDCYVEQYLDKARHVEAQVLADQHGNVIVVGTRDCSLQRRFQKLVEEAPAPYLSDDVRDKIHESAKRICWEAGYHGVGTVEYLVQGEAVSFLEVNTRLQVEHPVTEETSGIDLVRWQFRIADGDELSIVEDPMPRGHSIEFRINGEDAGRNFLPTPGRVSVYTEPAGPGVRVDSGVVQGSVIGGQFDSMLAKLIVTGEDRTQALERARRALAEYRIKGVATLLPFHRHVVGHPAFVGSDTTFGVYTTWIESAWQNPIEPHADGRSAEEGEQEPRHNLVVEVDGRRLEVSLPGPPTIGVVAAGNRTRSTARKRGSGIAAVAVGNEVTAPMQGTVVKVAVEEGQFVEAGELIAVLEAMKMENPVNAHKAGVVTGLSIDVGATISQGAALCHLNASGESPTSIGECS